MPHPPQDVSSLPVVQPALGSFLNICLSPLLLPRCLLTPSVCVCVFQGDKPHKCEVCGKCFSRKDKLKTHMRCHTGVKPYKCKTCDYAAADSSSLNKHLRIHSDERPFKCQICPYASRNSSQLTVHLRSHTGECPAALPPRASAPSADSSGTRWSPVGGRVAFHLPR